MLNQRPQPQTKWGGPIGAVRGLVVGLRHELCAGFDAHRSRWAELNAVWCRNGTKAWALAGAAFDIVTAGSGYHVLGHVHGLQLGGQVMPGVRTLLGQRVVNTPEFDSSKPRNSYIPNGINRLAALFRILVVARF